MFNYKALTALAPLRYLLHPSAKPYEALRARDAPAGRDLTVRFLGTATISFDDGHTVIMTDGFFSRPSLARVLFGTVKPNEQRICEALQRAHLTRVAAIFVGHSHYDHAMDTAIVAERTGAVVLGSASTANVAVGSGLTENRIRTFEDGDQFAFGDFRVRVFETPHSIPDRHPGFISSPLRPPARVSAYQLGGNYSFLIEHGDVRRILVVGSCNFTPGKFSGVKTEVVFLAIATLGNQGPQFAQAYWREAVEATGAKLVVPIHWDDFMRPLSEPFTPLPYAFDDFAKSMEMIRPLAERDGVAIRLPSAFATIDLDQR